MRIFHFKDKNKKRPYALKATLARGRRDILCHNTLPRRLLCLCFSILLVFFSAVDIAAGTPPATQSEDKFELLTPATGTTKIEARYAAIDYSHTDQGYVMCRYTGSRDRAAVQIAGPGGSEAYTYYLTGGKAFEAFPLTQGDGRYHIAIWECLTGTTYSLVLSTEFDMKLDNGHLPFLYASSVVNFDADSAAVRKGAELTANMQSASDKADAILDYITGHIEYDTEKAATVRTGYVSNPDETLRAGKGICLDYAVLAAAMLRSQGIPTKVVYGSNPEGEYHAWISVFTGEWILRDPSRSAGTKKEIPQSGYTVKYIN